MSVDVKKGEISKEASIFLAVNLNETGDVNEFIQKLEDEIKYYPVDRKISFLKEIQRKIEKEKAWHDGLCDAEKCSVKKYFETCLEKIKSFFGGDQNEKKS
jgi:hypothetical protein